tara:strand:- start:122 stop:604 length:483 start_codon:yes stop_codon:yes gene_type:complete
MELRHKDNPNYKIDESRKVFIYKNLHKNCWSLKQDGLVKAHVNDLSLFDCSFRVNAKGRARVLEEKRKNVHAGISGYIDLPWDHDEPIQNTFKKSESVSREGKQAALAMYNPYKYKSFVRVDDDSKPVFWSSTARLVTAKKHGDKDKVYFVPSIESANQI